MQLGESNTLYYGDNLHVLRKDIPAASIDLIYLDPPFNSQRNYNVLFKNESGFDSEAQIMAFEDTWHWTISAEQTYNDIVQHSSFLLSSFMTSLRQSYGTNQMLAYLVMMTARLIELHRVLKPTGSLYLHCDPTASHYLKIILDMIFGAENYRNEIVWKRRQGMHNTSRRFGSVTDTIFFYTKSDKYVFNKQFGEYNPEYIKKFFRFEDDKGVYALADLTNPADRPNLKYEYKGYPSPPKGWAVSRERMEQMDREGRLYFPPDPQGRIRRKRYLDELEGQPIESLWDDIQPISPHSAEKLGYPTQKPLVLLERIIQASSKEGDVVLDPFCGCGTAVAAAQKLGRRWIGIDITSLGISLQKYRLQAMFPGITFHVEGFPKDVDGAKTLLQNDRYQFQWWALSLVRARPIGGEEGKPGKKGRDRGIDGIIHFVEEINGRPKTVIVQVKSGHVKSGDIRDLRGVIEREQAAIGVFLTFETPTPEMLSEAYTAGVYEARGWALECPRIQILTIAELLDPKSKRQVIMPPSYRTFQEAPRVMAKPQVVQHALDVV